MDVQSQEFEIERVSKIASVDIWILPDNHSYKLTSSFFDIYLYICLSKYNST